MRKTTFFKLQIGNLFLKIWKKGGYFGLGTGLNTGPCGREKKPTGNFSFFSYLFSKLTFSKNSIRNTINVSSSLEPDQDRSCVGLDLGLNFLQKLSVDCTRKEL